MLAFMEAPLYMTFNSPKWAYEGEVIFVVVNNRGLTHDQKREDPQQIDLQYKTKYNSMIFSPWLKESITSLKFWLCTYIYDVHDLAY